MSEPTAIDRRIAAELDARPAQVAAAVALLDGGATVPFIARYRKEATGGLDDTQLRNLEERLGYLRELEERRETVRETIREQGNLSDELDAAISAAETKTRLEDLYRPYKPKRRTKGQKAIEAGLEPLAWSLMDEPERDPQAEAAAYADPDSEYPDAKAVLEGARAIVMEAYADDPELAGRLREHAWAHGQLRSRVIEGQESAGAKFSDYFDAAEPIRKIPSHRALALFRGRNEGVLRLDLEVGEEAAHAGGFGTMEGMIAEHFGVRLEGRPADDWRAEAVRFTWRVKLLTRVETELTNRLREAAEDEAIAVFGANLKDLLLAAPAGPRPVIGIDPGLRTGSKAVAIDATGAVTATETLYPHAPQKRWDAAIESLAAMARAHGAELVAIGNGTASRETDSLVADLQQRHPDLGLHRVMVSEAGASVYSASQLASDELPELDVAMRGAVSIARRLQDPLAELVKIDPKSIGVGQYQHDVSQTRLARTLDAVVEDCVNAVGVDANTASPALLARVAGLTPALAERLVAYRGENGPFRNRRQLKSVPRLGDKTFEQAAGFLRIHGGDQPLDASAVHPEAYPVVERILAATGRAIGDIIGDSAFLKGLDPADFTDEHFGVPTVSDILAELDKPGRDPRPTFETASFRDDVHQITDLEPGMILEGVVTNVTNFGAFVDVGVHQDGLVHISQLADRFVKDPRDEVRSGDVVKVRVLEVDVERKRIGLSRKMQADPAEGDGQGAPAKQETKKGPRKSDSGGGKQGGGKGKGQGQKQKAPEPQGALAEAFRKAQEGEGDG